MTPPQTPRTTTKSGKTASSASQNVFRVRQYLKYHGYVIETEDDTAIHPAVKELAEEIVKNRERNSTMKTTSHKKITTVRRKHQNDNELTFLIKFWQLLVRDSRQLRNSDMRGELEEPTVASAEASDSEHEDEVSLEGEPSDTAVLANESDPDDLEGPGDESIQRLEDIDEPDGAILAAEIPAWIDQEWDKDFLRSIWSTDFDRGVLPILDPQDDKLLAELISQSRVKTPRPDIAFGLEREAFDYDEQRINDVCDTSQIAHELFHIFFIVEAKSGKGTIAEAENQCCRGGASMVNARRLFNANAAPVDSEQNHHLGPDLDSLAFSLALTPSMGQLNVHWADVKKGGKVIWHMDFLEGYLFRKPDGVKELRHDINNILDWGTLKRANEIKKVIASIKQRRDAEADLASSSKKICR